jgi:hypothetical protein
MNGTSSTVKQEKYVNPACIRDIFSQSNGINRLGEHLKVFPGVTLVRNRVKIVSGKPSPGEAGKKKPIVKFSDKSRRSMMMTLAMIEEALRFWQDFTFADDVMQGLTINQRAKYSSRCLKNFKQAMEREGLTINGIWKKEFVKRKSGELMGQYIPHYHFVYSLPDMDQEKYFGVAMKIAHKWVKITGTKNEDKALAVALHPNSYRFIESRKRMQKYMSKYMVKNELPVFAESIGRNWGFIGSPKMAEGEVIEVTEREMVLFKRCLRKITTNKAGYYFRVALNREYTKFFMMIEGSTVIRYFEWLRVQ